MANPCLALVGLNFLSIDESEARSGRYVYYINRSLKDAIEHYNLAVYETLAPAFASLD